jgi:alcohol dehydrogenase
MSTAPFDFRLPTRIVFGADAIEQLGDLTRELPARRVLLVSDPGIAAAGHTRRAIESLERAGSSVRLFEGVHENPTTDDVAAGLAVASPFAPDAIIGLGGGSAMDCAKGINFLYSNGGRMQDYWGVNKASKPMLPMIAVPTTAGTGSEAQSFALISDAETHVKMACGDKKAACRVAILDPRLTLTQPPRVTALTGIDAIAHAVETYVSTKRSQISQAFSREAWHFLVEHFEQVLARPEDLEARGCMQLGACLAGLAIEHSMLGAAHGLANPLTAHFGVAHGQAVGVMLPHVIRFNAEVVSREYDDLGILCGTGEAASSGTSAEAVAELIASMARRTGLQTSLAACGVDKSALPVLADEAARQWTTSFNPRPADPAALLELYYQAWN